MSSGQYTCSHGAPFVALSHSGVMCSAAIASQEYDWVRPGLKGVGGGGGAWRFLDKRLATRLGKSAAPERQQGPSMPSVSRMLHQMHLLMFLSF